jgi:hypothetical protein
MLIMGLLLLSIGCHHALVIGWPVHRVQEDGFDPSPIGYKLAGRQGARVEEPFMGNCIVVVQFDLPKRTEEQAVKGATSTAPIYRGLAAKGLIRKDYVNGDAGTGGVYLWETRASAEAWFTEDRMVELTRRFGVRPRLTWYDTHVTVDNLKGETRVNGKTLAEAG